MYLPLALGDRGIMPKVQIFVALTIYHVDGEDVNKSHRLLAYFTLAALHISELSHHLLFLPQDAHLQHVYPTTSSGDPKDLVHQYIVLYYPKCG